MFSIFAEVAQLVEQLICNQSVVGSNPIFGLKRGDNRPELFSAKLKIMWVAEAARQYRYKRDVIAPVRNELVCILNDGSKHLSELVRIVCPTYPFIMGVLQRW